ncbi:hypothetical protein Barb4_03271 [Bacteroidales bacterium Barb4]|nr:hypothetical protein Barb4_03271 [Bacteroidales bacterium Barb4]
MTRRPSGITRRLSGITGRPSGITGKPSGITGRPFGMTEQESSERTTDFSPTCSGAECGAEIRYPFRIHLTIMWCKCP